MSQSIDQALLLVSLLATIVTASSTADMVQNWTAYLEPHSDETKYLLVFEWDHVNDLAIFVDGEDGGRVYNAEDDERCNGDSTVVAMDGEPYWMPRFFPRAVSAEITAVTGVKYASADWQPCGHKEITICHAESHYDFHMYYAEEAEMNALPMCDIGTETNPDLPVCLDSPTVAANADYFKLINNSIPLSMNTSDTDGIVDVEFCVDATSAILRSGIHYGDVTETNEEWRVPVTIIGSHDCTLKFFEPMFSWKWASDCVDDSPWPVFEVRDIAYTRKGIESLPDGWTVEVSDGCQASSCNPTDMDAPLADSCHIKMTVEGTRCPEEGCTVLQECGSMTDCATRQPYEASQDHSSGSLQQVRPSVWLLPLYILAILSY